MELLSGDLGLAAMLAAGIAAATIAILLDFSPELRRRRAAATAETQQLH